MSYRAKVELTAAMEGALRNIKNCVVGEKLPRWADQRQTTITRGCIADICDFGLGNASCETKEQA